jgi:formate hydrogenlyase transcriptional activator
MLQPDVVAAKHSRLSPCVTMKMPANLVSVMQPEPKAACNLTHWERRQALLAVSESVAVHRDLPALFHDLAQRLPGVVSFDFLSLVLHDPVRNIMRLHILESRIPHDALEGSERPIDESPGGVVWQTQRPVVVKDTKTENRFPEIMQLLLTHNIRSMCMFPLTTAHRRLGAMGFGSTHAGAYGEDEIEFLSLVTRQVAVAVDNALSHQDAQEYQAQLAHERDRWRVLLEVNNAVVSNLDRHELFAAISAALRQVVCHDYISLALLDGEKKRLRLHVLDFPDGKGLVKEEMSDDVESCLPGRAILSRKPVVVVTEDCEESRYSELARLHIEEGLKVACFVPLVSRDLILGTLNVASKCTDVFSQEDVDLLVQVANQIAIAVDNAKAFAQIAELKEKLAEEKLYLQEEIRTEHNFEEIVGESAALKRVLKQVETVAPTDSTVLIQGETGTGKEVIARALHDLSSRRERTFVKVNCAAIPSGLLESELFGHEKGAFTGAIAQKIGRFELAHQGTLFLDEIGDIPLELQPKLLRVLQEQEFERLGGTRTIRADVRLIAATNRDLSRMVAAHEFRSDLYYRLNVFPILAPPLRDRPEDVGLLVRYFVQKYARRMNKQIESIPSEAMDVLSKWQWPGNVRELENVIERAVILSNGPTLQVPLGDFRAPDGGSDGSVATLEAAERAHILRALGQTQWVVGGPDGAAALLGVKRTTLQSRMRKLGISPNRHP